MQRAMCSNWWPCSHNVLLFTAFGGGQITICCYLHHMAFQLHMPLPSSMFIHTLEMEELAACLGRLAWGSLSRSSAICIHAYECGRASSRPELPPWCLIPLILQGHPACWCVFTQYGGDNFDHVLWFIAFGGGSFHNVLWFTSRGGGHSHNCRVMYSTLWW